MNMEHGAQVRVRGSGNFGLVVRPAGAAYIVRMQTGPNRGKLLRITAGNLAKIERAEA